MYSWDFACAVCGEELPSKRTRVCVHGPAYVGWHERDATVYDTSKEGYFFRLTNSDVLLNSYIQEKKEKLEKDKKKLEERIEAKVLDEEFRDSLLSEKVRVLEENYKKEKRDFEHFVYEISLDFQSHTINKNIPTLHPKCFDRVLEESKSVTEDKYVMGLEEDGYSLKRLKTRSEISLEDFSRIFARFSDSFDLPRNKKEISLEFLHFSEC